MLSTANTVVARACICAEVARECPKQIQKQEQNSRSKQNVPKQKQTERSKTTKKTANVPKQKQKQKVLTWAKKLHMSSSWLDTISPLRYTDCCDLMMPMKSHGMVRPGWQGLSRTSVTSYWLKAQTPLYNSQS
jgi:hypothetical protein